MSVVLALDTSGRSAEVAVAEGGQVLACVAHDGAGAYAESLLPLVDRALARARLGPSDLAAVAVVEGPGSFTGLRIGVVTAKSLCFARGLPLLAAPTLRLLAMAAARGVSCPTSARYVGLADAGRGHAFAEIFLPAAESSLEPVAPAQRIALTALAEQFAGGPGVAVVAAASPESLLTARALAQHSAAVVAWEVASLAAELARAASVGDPAVRAVDPATLVPTYLSPSQAERARGVDLCDEVHRPAANFPAAEPS
jgi:tRNA threonylcarbamoyladenosine biosynthesis protein TsaB